MVCWIKDQKGAAMMQIVENKCDRSENDRLLEPLSLETAKKVNSFHKSFPIYEETPLVKLKEFAKYAGVKNVYVKDESYRFGLNAFKVLGGSYAIGKYLAECLHKDISELPFSVMTSEEIKKELGDITFISATDGNHGRGVAWTANQLKQKSVILMPKGSAIERLENIRKEGADASITDLNYDDAVRLADKMAKENGWVMVQDTAWEGYEDIPTWIMQGYMSMVYEAYQQLEGVRPTHIFIQAGVGSLAGAVVGFFSKIYKDNPPVMIVVEPDKADCLFESAKANDGKRHFITDDMNTIMAGLACGEPNTISWEILKANVNYFISCPDYMAAQGMRILGNPLGKDSKIISGESGAAGFGVASEVLRNDTYATVKEKLGIDEESVLLFFNSEGDTDKENYRKIVWDGAYQA